MRLIGYWEPLRRTNRSRGFICTGGPHSGYFMLMVVYEEDKNKWRALWWDWARGSFISWDAEFDTMKEAQRYAEVTYAMESA